MSDVSQYDEIAKESLKKLLEIVTEKEGLDQFLNKKRQEYPEAHASFVQSGADLFSSLDILLGELSDAALEEIEEQIKIERKQNPNQNKRFEQSKKTFFEQLESEDNELPKKRELEWNELEKILVMARMKRKVK